MQFRRTKHDYTQWQRCFAIFPKKVGEMGGQNEYVWLEHYEWRFTGGGHGCYYYEARRIGATNAVRHTCYTD